MNLKQKPTTNLGVSGLKRPWFSLPWWWAFLFFGAFALLFFSPNQGNAQQQGQCDVANPAACYCIVGLPCNLSLQVGTQDPEQDPLIVTFDGTVHNNYSISSCQITSNNLITTPALPGYTCTTPQSQSGSGPYTATGSYIFSVTANYTATVTVCDDSGHCSSANEKVIQVTPFNFNWCGSTNPVCPGTPDHTSTSNSITWNWNSPSAEGVVTFVIYKDGANPVSINNVYPVTSWTQALGGYNVSSGSIRVFALFAGVQIVEITGGPKTYYTLAAVPTNLRCTQASPVNTTTRSVKWEWNSGGGQKDYNAFYPSFSNPTYTSGWITDNFWTNNNTNYLIVRARNQDDVNTGNQPTSGYNGCYNLPGAPQNFTGTPLSGSEINWSWEPPYFGSGVPAPTYYVVYDAITNNFLCQVSHPATSCISSGHQSGTNYSARSYSIYQITGSSFGSYYSNTASTTTWAPSPIITSQHYSRGNITWTWVAGGAGNYNYTCSVNGSASAPCTSPYTFSPAFCPEGQTDPENFILQVWATPTSGPIQQSAPAVDIYSIDCDAFYNGFYLEYTQPYFGYRNYSTPIYVKIFSQFGDITAARYCWSYQPHTGIPEIDCDPSSTTPVKHIDNINFPNLYINGDLPRHFGEVDTEYYVNLGDVPFTTVPTSGHLEIWAQDARGPSQAVFFPVNINPYSYDPYVPEDPSEVVSVLPNPNNTGTQEFTWTVAYDQDSFVSNCGGTPMKPYFIYYDTAEDGNNTYELMQDDENYAGLCPYNGGSGNIANPRIWTGPNLYEGAPTSLPAGTYTFKVLAMDHAGNITPLNEVQASAPVLIDKTAPLPPNCTLPGVYPSGVNVTCTPGADQGTPKSYGENVRYTNNLTVPTCGSSPFPAGGLQVSSTTTLRFITCDAAGNFSSPVLENTYTVAAYQPLTFQFNPLGSQIWKSAGTPVTVTASSPNGSIVNPIKYCWSTTTCNPATGTTINNGATTTASPPGEQYLYAWAQDSVGQIGTDDEGPYRFDNIRPTSQIISPATDGSWQGASFIVDVADADTGGAGLATTCYYSVEVSSDSRTYTPTITSSYLCNGTIGVSVGQLSDCRIQGTNTCRIRTVSQDNSVPAWSSFSATRYFNIDWQAPMFSKMTPAQTPTAQAPQIAFDVSDNYGIFKVELWRAQYTSECRNGTEPECDWGSGPVNETMIPGQKAIVDSTLNISGTYWYGLHALDNAGNCIDEQGHHCGGVENDSLLRLPVGPVQVVFDNTPPSPNPPTLSQIPPIAETSITWQVSQGSDSGVGLHATPYGFSNNINGPYVFQASRTKVENNLGCNQTYTRYAVIKDSLGTTTTPDMGSGSTSATCIERSALLQGNPNTAGWTYVSTFNYTPSCAPKGGFTLLVPDGCSTQVSINNGAWNQISNANNSPQTYNMNSGNGYRFRTIETDTGGTITSATVPESGEIQVDAIAPVVNNFVIPGDIIYNGTSATNGPPTILWNVSDTGGSGINRIELWRVLDDGGSPGTNWQQVNLPIAPTDTFVTDTTVTNSGRYWYGLHVIDNAGNCIYENGAHCINGGVTSDSLDPRTPKGPIKIIVDFLPPEVTSVVIDGVTYQYADSPIITNYRPDITINLSDNLTEVYSTSTTVRAVQIDRLIDIAGGSSIVNYPYNEWGPDDDNQALINDEYIIEIGTNDILGNNTNLEWRFTVANNPPNLPEVQ